MKIKTQLATLLLFTCASTFAKSDLKKETPWSGKQAAVVLTYDDALNGHLDIVIPQLNAAELKATFYTNCNSTGFMNRIEEWEAVSTKGFELGNHTMFHPCNGNLPGRSWVNPDYNLGEYSLQRITEELTLANLILSRVDGQKDRTFAFTCGDMYAGSESFVDTVQHLFPAARGVEAGYTYFNASDRYNIKCFSMNGQSAAEMIAIVEEGIKQHAMTVFLFHGVGGDHSLNVDADAHQELIEYIEKNKDRLWNGTMLEAVELLPKEGN